MQLPSSHVTRRSGVVLLVVLAMLALFASLALSFVFYADAEAVAAMYNLQSTNRDTHDVDPEVLASYFLNQLVYGTSNPDSSMQGHSLGETQWGYNPAALNHLPFNGPGRSDKYTVSPPATPTFDPTTAALNNLDMIQFTTFSTDGFQRKPGYYNYNPPANAPYVEGTNVAWTAPDRNNMFLAVMDVDGRVLLPSFHRPWIPVNPTDANPKSAHRYLTLRPHPSWHQVAGVPTFVTPDSDAGGDVRNSEAGLGYNGGNNDSFWMDLGFPVMSAPNGKRYKALFAPLIVDLSNRLHLWAHGNRVPTNAWSAATNYTTGNAVNSGGLIYMCLANNNNTPPAANPAYWFPMSGHVSNQGIGPAEVNLSRISMMNPMELQALFNFKYGGVAGTATSRPMGVPAGFPTPSYAAPRGGPWFNRLDYYNSLSSESVGSRAPYFGFSVTMTSPVATPGAVPASPLIQTVNVSATHGVHAATGYPWTIYKGMSLNVIDNDPPPPMSGLTTLSESGAVGGAPPITVIDVDHNAKTITAKFQHGHNANKALTRSFNPGFPNYPPGYNAAGSTFTATNTPHALGMVKATSPNMPALPASHMEALLRFTGTNSPALTSELVRRMPLTFADVKNRNRVTTVNWRNDRVIGAPYLTFDRNQANNFTWDASVNHPRLTVAPTVGDPSNPSSVQVNSDYGVGDWRNTLSGLLRIDLNRKLTDFPTPAANSVYTTTPEFTQAATAIKDRQTLALDIYNALVMVCGARDPNVVPGMTATSGEFQAARWLAQLAANIVDYVDYDDFSTAFCWYKNNPIPSDADWVFGTEFPRLVISEVYAQHDNDPTDPNLGNMPPTASRFNLNVWVEVDNPLATNGGGAYPFDSSHTQLKINGTPVYQVVVYQSSAGLTANLRDAANPRVSFGEPDPATYTPLTPVAGAAKPTNWGPGPNLVVTSNLLSSVGNTVYVLGPQTSFVDPAYNPNLAPAAWNSMMGYNRGNRVSSGGLYYVCHTTHMTSQPPTNTAYWVPSGYESPSLSFRPTGMDPMANSGVTVLLQRLAVPHLPHQPNPAATSSPYNPYITVDYLNNAKDPWVPQGLKVFENRKYNSTGAIPVKSKEKKTAFIRGASYTAHPTQVRSVAAFPNGGNVNTPSNNLFGGVASPDWVIHLDRPAINPLEILHVSGFRPHEYTQQFVVPGPTGTPQKYSHYAPWFDPTGRLPLYRLLEVLGTADHSAGTFVGGRTPARINLNTIMDPEIFLALCDPHDQAQYTAVNGGPTPVGVPLFDSGQIMGLFNKVIMSRRSLPAGPLDGAGPNVAPTNDGNPFRPFNDPDIKKTWLREDPLITTTPPTALFALQGPHPYKKAALMQKIYNNITTTSSTFAVWFTVGYFEVVDESVRPARLGAEIGRAENRHIRHRFFSVVDRSAMRLFATQATAATTAPGAQFMSFASNLTPNFAPWGALFNGRVPVTAGGVPITVQPGMLLEIGTGATAETVRVKDQPVWDPLATYAINTLVVFNNGIFRCTTPNTNKPPSTNPTMWAADTFEADFTLVHAANVPIVCRGNPGPSANFDPTRPPIPAYNPRRDSEVVLHLSVIQ